MIHASDKASCDKVAAAGYTNVRLLARPLARRSRQAPLCKPHCVVHQPGRIGACWGKVGAATPFQGVCMHGLSASSFGGVAFQHLLRGGLNCLCGAADAPAHASGHVCVVRPPVLAYRVQRVHTAVGPAVRGRGVGVGWEVGVLGGPRRHAPGGFLAAAGRPARALLPACCRPPRRAPPHVRPLLRLACGSVTHPACGPCCVWPAALSLSRRYMLVARAVWMGFHVLMLDTDSFLYHDPYAYFKKEPLAGIPFMSLQDGGNLINGGAWQQGASGRAGGVGRRRSAACARTGGWILPACLSCSEPNYLNTAVLLHLQEHSTSTISNHMAPWPLPWHPW